MPETLNLRVDALRGSYYDEKGIRDYARIIELSKTISNKSEIARQVGIHVSQVSRMLKPEYSPFETGARYFSDIERTAEWFDDIWYNRQIKRFIWQRFHVLHAVNVVRYLFCH